MSERPLTVDEVRARLPFKIAPRTLRARLRASGLAIEHRGQVALDPSSWVAFLETLKSADQRGAEATAPAFGSKRTMNNDKYIKYVDDCPLVIITWEDSRQPLSCWTRLSDLPDGKSVQCATVGWLLKDGDDAKVIAQTMGDFDSEEHIQASGVMVIPARCVLSIEKLVEEGITSSSEASCDRDVASPLMPQVTGSPSS